MQTHSHFLMTAALNRVLQHRQVIVHRNTFLLGAVLPDIPFWLLTAGGRYTIPGLPARRRVKAPWFTSTCISTSMIRYGLLATTYFTHRSLLALGVVGWLGIQNSQPWSTYLLWFVLGATLHSLIDIATHHNDGPLLFFPFDWTYRFPSPISYWDPAYYGAIFMPLELLLDGWLVIYLLAPRWRRWLNQKQAHK